MFRVFDRADKYESLQSAGSASGFQILQNFVRSNSPADFVLAFNSFCGNTICSRCLKKHSFLVFCSFHNVFLELYFTVNVQLYFCVLDVGVVFWDLSVEKFLKVFKPSVYLVLNVG